MLSALSTGHQIGLAGIGAAFIVFSLVSSFVLPARNPNFPGRARNWYLLLCVAFFIAMMGAVLVFGVEEKAAGESAAAGDPAAGKALFTAKACTACHAFTPAGSTAEIGPPLDDLKASADTAGQPLDEFVAASIKDPDAYITPGYKKGVMPTLPLSKTEVDDLVAFLTSG